MEQLKNLQMELHEHKLLEKFGYTRILEIINIYLLKDDITDFEFCCMVEKISHIVHAPIKEKIHTRDNITLEDYKDVADFMVELIDFSILFFFRSYSMDTSDAPYKVPYDKLQRTKDQYAKELQNKKESIVSDFLGTMFSLIYLTPFLKATQHRQKVKAQTN